MNRSISIAAAALLCGPAWAQNSDIHIAPFRMDDPDAVRPLEEQNRGLSRQETLLDLAQQGWVGVDEFLPEGETFRIHTDYLAPGVMRKIVIPEGGGDAIELSPAVLSYFRGDWAATIENSIRSVLSAACGMQARPTSIVGSVSVPGFAQVQLSWDTAEVCD